MRLCGFNTGILLLPDSCPSYLGAENGMVRRELTVPGIQSTSMRAVSDLTTLSPQRWVWKVMHEQQEAL